MTIPLVPFEGRMSYCLIRCIHMLLAYQGHDYSLPWLECVSGEPFGFVYMRRGEQFIAVNGYVYHLAGEHLLRTLNYTYTYTSSSDETEALTTLEQALHEGPVIAGMLDMGYLTYNPDYQLARGADHAVVVLALQHDAVIVHDPAGYVAVPLPLTDFLAGWQRDIYTGKPYGLWHIGSRGMPPTNETIWERTLARARENFMRTSETLSDGTTLMYGPQGIRSLAADLRMKPDRNLASLYHFSWRVSGQRCLDSAIFLRDQFPHAAAIRWEECQLYGALQQASVANERSSLLDLLERLAEHEERFIALLN